MFELCSYIPDLFDSLMILREQEKPVLAVLRYLVLLKSGTPENKGEILRIS